MKCYEILGTDKPGDEEYHIGVVIEVTFNRCVRSLPKRLKNHLVSLRLVEITQAQANEMLKNDPVRVS